MTPLRILRPLFIAAACACAVVALGQANPFNGYDEFPQFRQLSGLSGGGYGLDFDGWGALSGAVAFSTPIGYSLGHDQVRIGGGETLFSSRKIAHDDSTGKAFGTYGHTFGSFNVTYSYFVKSVLGDASTNLQVGYVPKTRFSPSLSIGVQDLGGHGGSAGQNFAGDRRSSRSFFASSTVAVPIGERAPLYISAGWGTRRFGKGFASSSYQIAGPVRAWAEYDGWGFNEGILLATRPNGFNSDGDPQHSFEADVLLGFIRGRYPTLAITFGY